MHEDAGRGRGGPDSIADLDLARQLRAARRRLAEALPGSPDEDAAWLAVQALEARAGGAAANPPVEAGDAVAIDLPAGAGGTGPGRAHGAALRSAPTASGDARPGAASTPGTGGSPDEPAPGAHPRA